MSAPNHSATVNRTAEDYPQLLEENSYESISEFMMILARRLVEEDPSWGYLTKTPGEKHFVLPDNQRVSVDSFIYRKTQQVVDCLTNAMDPGEAGPAWQEKEKRPDNNWWEITAFNSKPSEDSGDSGGGDSSYDPAKDNEQDSRISALEQQVAELRENMIQFGSSVALRMSKGLLVCADNGGGTEDKKPVTLSSRVEGPYADESFKIERGQ